MKNMMNMMNMMNIYIYRIDLPLSYLKRCVTSPR